MCPQEGTAWDWARGWPYLALDPNSCSRDAHCMVIVYIFATQIYCVCVIVTSNKIQEQQTWAVLIPTISCTLFLVCKKHSSSPLLFYQHVVVVGKMSCLIPFKRICYGYRVPHRLTTFSYCLCESQGHASPGLLPAVTKHSEGTSAGSLLPNARFFSRGVFVQCHRPGGDFLRTALQSAALATQSFLPSFPSQESDLPTSIWRFFCTPNSLPLNPPQEFPSINLLYV